MALLLGIDTGGTYTDAVLYDDARDHGRVLAKAKALTTHHRLSDGVGAAVGAVLDGSGVAPQAVSLASISTTLATNALVEGRGGRVCLVYIGFDEADVNRAGLREALGEDPLIRIAGGHTATGAPRAPLDLEGLAAQVETVRDDVEGFAVCAIFGVRNPEHEIAARDLIRAQTGAPVTCGHELSSRLHGPRTALTCVLNARLIGMISDLIAATEQALAAPGVHAPLMLVRGDGSLVSAAFARARPIETILSGPAASLVGASALTGLEDALVSDIGGTTTDIAILRGGRPRLSPEGATVGGHRTMIDAVAMVTHGLGGDSEVRIDESRLEARLLIGPSRRIPVSLLAQEHRALVHRTLERQAAATHANANDGLFVVPTGLRGRRGGLKPPDLEVLGRLAGEPAPLDEIASSRAGRAAVARLAGRGLIRIGGFTPSDAAHALGLHDAWDRAAAEAAAGLMARRKNGRGQRVAPTPAAFAEWTVRTLERRSAEALLAAALAEDGIEEAAANAPLIAAALDRRGDAARIDIGSALPVVGLGASAPTYYPAVARLLGAPCATPEHADVANAVGAVAGRVEVERTVRIVPAGEGRYRVLGAEGAELYADHAEAVAAARATAERLAEADARAAGAGAVVVTTRYEESAPLVEGKPMFVEGVAVARAAGRPALNTATATAG